LGKLFGILVNFSTEPLYVVENMLLSRLRIRTQKMGVRLKYNFSRERRREEGGGYMNRF
jgi:hypothetical protein